MQEEDDDFLYRPHRAKGQRVDPAIQRMAIAAGGVSVLVILIAWLWGGIHYSFGPPPVVNPPDLPLRIVPADPGGLIVPGADMPIMSGQMKEGAPHLAPAGTAPDIAALNQAAGLNGSGGASAMAVNAQPQQMAQNTAQAAGQAAGQGAAAPSAAPASDSADDNNSPDAPQSVTPAASQAPRPGSTATSAAQAEGLSGVQLAATSDEEGALSVWAKLQQQFPDLLKGRTPEIIPAIVGGKSVWRLRLGGFSSVSAAQGFCAKLTNGGAACTVAAF